MKNDYVLGDAFEGMEDIENDSVDLIFTSMPDLSQTDFGKDEILDYQSFQWRAIGEFDRLIKDTGFIVLCQTDRRVNGAILANHHWYIDCMYDRGFKLKDEKIVVRNSVGRKDMYYMTYQYMSVFTRKGKITRKGDWLIDIIVDQQEKTVPGQPTWSQDFCRLVIETLTRPGDFVIDPFAAAGPVLYAAKNLGRRYWGAENTPERYNKDFHLFGGTLNV